MFHTCKVGIKPILKQGSIPGLGISPGEGYGYPFLYSCPGNPVDRGTWWPTEHSVTESDATEQLTHFDITYKLH